MGKIRKGIERRMLGTNVALAWDLSFVKPSLYVLEIGIYGVGPRSIYQSSQTCQFACGTLPARSHLPDLRSRFEFGVDAPPTSRCGADN